MDHSYQLHHCCNSPAVAKWAAVSKMYERGPKKMFLLSVMIPVREWPRTSAAPLWRIKAFVIVFMFRGWCCVTPTCVVPDHLQLNSTLFHTHTHFVLALKLNTDIHLWDCNTTRGWIKRWRRVLSASVEAAGFMTYTASLISRLQKNIKVAF